MLTHYTTGFFYYIVPLSEAGFSKIFLKTFISVHITCKDREKTICCLSLCEYIVYA